ncbi:gag protein [Artemisia annua]|uniref:Gag protein n=1 Tax=Artemisia annua TaxID=35608 RepID=A0A2U1P3U4_ARTAN|nr:gag protein [Artemisia annua]
MNISHRTTENHTPDHTPENASEDAPGDPVMQFVVQNFEQINAMYSAFSSKRKEANSTSHFGNDDLPVIKPWQTNQEGLPEGVAQPMPEEITLSDAPGDPVMQFVVQNFEQINAMYSAFSSKRKEANSTSHFGNDDLPVIKPWQINQEGLPEGVAQPMPEEITLSKTEKNIRDLVASPFTARIRDYDMPDGLKVPTNLKTYDGMSDPDDHLTIFMGTMDVHKLPEPAWCRFFHITLCGAARFWYDNLSPGRDSKKTKAEILGIRQRSDESLRDYLGRFGKETLHMTDRSDGMMTGAFISGLRPSRFFKDLIAWPPASMEDLFTQAHNFI